jgi:hypothetical protein
MARYAANTGVSLDQSRAEIERTLRRYGAGAFAYGWEGDIATVMFKLGHRHIRFRLVLPDRNDRAFTHTPGRNLPRSTEAADREWEQAQRQRWRALALVIKAKLEAVEAGITTAEDEFLAHTMLPDGRTFGEWAAPQLEMAYESGRMPALMPGGAR